MRDKTPSAADGCTARGPRQTMFSKSPTKTRTGYFSKDFLDFYKNISAFSLTTIAGLQCLPVLCRSLGLQVLHRSSGGLVLKIEGSTTVLRRSPGLQVLHRFPDNLGVDSVEEVRWDEVLEVVREVREVVGCLPSQPAANPTADTVSHQGPSPPTDGQVYC